MIGKMVGIMELRVYTCELLPADNIGYLEAKHGKIH